LFAAAAAAAAEAKEAWAAKAGEINLAAAGVYLISRTSLGRAGGNGVERPQKTIVSASWHTEMLESDGGRLL